MAVADHSFIWILRTVYTRVILILNNFWNESATRKKIHCCKPETTENDFDDVDLCEEITEDAPDEDTP